MAHPPPGQRPTTPLGPLGPLWPRRRDRHGRGLRGPLAPAGVPLSLTRSELFEDLVRTSVSRLEDRWAPQLASIQFAVEDVPHPDLLSGAPPAPLGRSEAADGERPARIVVYRRAVEARARGPRAREVLVHEVVVERLAELLGLDPSTVDPDSDEGATSDGDD